MCICKLLPKFSLLNYSIKVLGAVEKIDIIQKRYIISIAGSMGCNVICESTPPKKKASGKGRVFNHPF